MSYQTKKNDDEYKQVDKSVYFGDVISAVLSEEKDSLKIFTVKFNERMTLKQDEITIPLETIASLLNYIASSGISRSFNANAVYDYSDVAAAKEDEFLRQNAAAGYAKPVEVAGVVSAVPKMEQIFNEVGRTMNGPKGHGFAAEYGNTAIDRMLGRKVDHIGKDFKENGADRILHTSSGDVKNTIKVL